jgi:hypothetical protein
MVVEVFNGHGGPNGVTKTFDIEAVLKSLILVSVQGCTGETSSG